MTAPILRFLKSRLRAAASGLRHGAAPRPRFAPNQHADAELSRLHKWTAHDVVFDVGANDGRTVLRLHERLNNPRFYAFEPVRATYDQLVAQTADVPQVRTFNLALGAEAGRQTIHLHDLSVMNSFYRPENGSGRSETVEVRTLDQLMTEEGVDFIHFLKIDTEGHELEVLKGARQALTAATIQAIQLEVGFGQMDRTDTTLESARVFLAEFGYRLYGIYNQCRQDGQLPASWADQPEKAYKAEVLAYVDALFVRANLKAQAPGAAGETTSGS